MRHLRWFLVAAAVAAVPQTAAVVARPAAASAAANAEDARLTAFLDVEFAQDLKLRPQLATRLGIKEGEDRLDDISDVTDPEVFSRQLLPKETATLVPFGGQYVIRTDTITAIDGTPPKRLVVIAFNSPQTAKAWASSAALKEISDLAKKSAKSRVFIADGMIQ